MQTSAKPNFLSRLFSNTWATLFCSLAALVGAYALQRVSISDALIEQAREPLANFLHELGFALFIGVMIAEGIERLSRDEQLKEVTKLKGHVKENVIEAVYGSKIANIFFKPFKEPAIATLLLGTRCDYEVIITCPDSSIKDESIAYLDVALTYDVLKPVRGSLCSR